MVEYLLASGYEEVSGYRCPKCGSENVISSGVRTLWSNPVDSEALGMGLEIRCANCLHYQFVTLHGETNDLDSEIPDWAKTSSGSPD